MMVCPSSLSLSLTSSPLLSFSVFSYRIISGSCCVTIWGRRRGSEGFQVSLLLRCLLLSVRFDLWHALIHELLEQCAALTALHKGMLKKRERQTRTEGDMSESGFLIPLLLWDLAHYSTSRFVEKSRKGAGGKGPRKASLLGWQGGFLWALFALSTEKGRAGRGLNAQRDRPANVPERSRAGAELSAAWGGAGSDNTWVMDAKRERTRKDGQRQVSRLHPSANYHMSQPVPLPWEPKPSRQRQQATRSSVDTNCWKRWVDEGRDEGKGARTVFWAFSMSLIVCSWFNHWLPSKKRREYI